MDLGVTVTTYQNDELFAGDFPRVTLPVTIKSGSGVLKRGTVLGIITAEDKATAYNDGASDGSETARCILAHDVDATSSDVLTTAYYTGEFNEDALTGIDANGIKDLRDKTIFVKKIK